MVGMQMKQTLGERVIVTGHGRTVRGWLEVADDERVVVRLPDEAYPEKPGFSVAEFACVKKAWISMVTCNSWCDHHSIGIGYVDPKWSRDEEAIRRSCTRKGVVDEEQVRLERRVREMSLAVPLAKASTWSDFGRMPMWEAARRELGMSSMYPDSVVAGG
jgi:hypothetical protein